MRNRVSPSSSHSKASANLLRGNLDQRWASLSRDYLRVFSVTMENDRHWKKSKGHGLQEEGAEQWKRVGKYQRPRGLREAQSWH